MKTLLPDWPLTFYVRILRAAVVADELIYPTLLFTATTTTPSDLVMPSVLPALFGLVIAVVLIACAAIFTPKGPQQTHTNLSHARSRSMLFDVDGYLSGAAPPAYWQVASHCI
ncbi:hypothetical protein DFH05DRAFT_1525514 [Lentinula detonsa]|uniref:Uncharacterized protein n=1 Tax=Lentinula detonsa TaxID=2804962 RepID=A0A9W8TXK6_9AGAR|nr:hypothetical protein DFH05DRAFT_1525514 [Lentinula detonsa]